MRHPLGSKAAPLGDFGVSLGGAMLGRARRARVDVGAQRLQFPRPGASLDADFVRQLGYALGRGLVSASDFATFSGSAGSTRVGESGLIVGASAPRFEYDPVSMVCRGLLVEEQGTNEAIQTESLDNAAWSKINGGFTSTNVVSAPDGTLTGDLFVANAGVIGYVSRNYAHTAGTTYTRSIWYKPAGRASFSILAPGSALYADGINRAATFTFTGAGSYSTSGSGAAGEIRQYPDGWYRCGLTYTPDLTAVVGMQYRDVALGNGVDGVYMWGAQWDTGPRMLSYVPATGGSKVTRTADFGTINGILSSPWFNPDEGTFLVEGSTVDVFSGATRRLIEVGTSTERFVVGFSGATMARFLTVAGGLTQADITAAVASCAGVNKLVCSYGGGRVQMAANGSLSALTIAPAMPAWSASSVLRIGSDVGTAAAFANAPQRRLTYWPRSLPAAMLRELSL
jgi:hypothetical protein